MDETSSRFKLLVTVNAEQSHADGEAREGIARYIGECVLDAWHGTHVAQNLGIGLDAIPDLVEIHKELLYSEQAVLLLTCERIQYHFEATDDLLAQARWFIDHEIEARKERMHQSPGGGGT